MICCPPKQETNHNLLLSDLLGGVFLLELYPGNES